MDDGETGIKLLRLQRHHPVGKIKSGDSTFAPLSNFIKKQAIPFEENSLARTYVLYDQDKNCILAYITLVCSEVTSEQKLVDKAGFSYKTYPAVKIARLLVDSRYRTADYKGIGKYLVEFAIGIAKTEVCPAIGCRFVMVDAKKESVGFYEKCGFTMIDTDHNRELEAPVLFLDLHKATGK